MKWSDRGMIVAMLYVFFMPLVIGALAFWPHMPAILHRIGSSTTAAWVQAIGSIAAIAGATSIAGRQSREALAREERASAAALKRDYESLQARRSSLIGLCDMLVTAASNSSLRLSSGGSEQLRNLPGSPLKILSSFESSLASFPFEALESSSGAAILFKIRSIVPVIIDLMEDIVGSAGSGEENRFVDLRNQFVQHVKSLQEEYWDLRTALDFPSPSASQGATTRSQG